MVNKYTQVVASFKEDGSTLVRKGNCGTLDPIYKSATKSTTLGTAFIEHALNLDDRGKSQRPKCPRGQNIHHWKKSPRGRIADRWNTATDNEKIQVELMTMCHDQGWLLTSFELL